MVLRHAGKAGKGTPLGTTMRTLLPSASIAASSHIQNTSHKPPALIVKQNKALPWHSVRRPPSSDGLQDFIAQQIHGCASLKTYTPPAELRKDCFS